MGRYSFDHVKDKYGVPVKRGQRVIHDGEVGTVTCGDGPYVRVRFDRHRRAVPCHPLSLDYGDGIAPAARLAWHNARITAWNDRLNQRITLDEYRARMAIPLTPTA